MTTLPPPGPSFAEELKELRALAEENNRILRKMERRAFWARVAKLFSWLLFLGISVWLYYQLQPYIASLEEMLRASQKALEQFSQFQP